jgi:hypothetical protein
VLRVRFEGGYRMGFASHNFWTNNVVGDADDRSVEAKNNPNANYIAAAAGGDRVPRAPDARSGARRAQPGIAEDDWAHAIVGVEGPSTWHTPAFAATPHGAGGHRDHRVARAVPRHRKRRYADKAVELARVVTASQQVARVGRAFPLSGFFYTGPDRDTLFHQFHRAADQAPVVALAQLVEALPEHPDWMQWYAAVARHAEYQKRARRRRRRTACCPPTCTAWRRLADGARLGRPLPGDARRVRAQVRAGTPMGDGWYLRAFPVWFARRGNYGVLLSQAKALSAASRLRGDSAGMDLAQRQAQWVVGRNPFVQSTMYGEGYDWAQQYSVSSGDFVGSLPVGMQSRGTSDLPYWPSQNMYVLQGGLGAPDAHAGAHRRWLWLMADLLDRDRGRRRGSTARAVRPLSPRPAAPHPFDPPRDPMRRLLATLSLACALTTARTADAQPLPLAEYQARRDSLAARLDSGVVVAFGAREPVALWTAYRPLPAFAT